MKKVTKTRTLKPDQHCHSKIVFDDYQPKLGGPAYIIYATAISRLVNPDFERTSRRDHYAIVAYLSDLCE
jgi:hypothetical protein